MFELFERREKQRKTRELLEVCPDISEEEAAAALDMCNGREDEAAASLVSDPAFKRRVQSHCGTGPPIAAPRQGSGNGGGRANWSARPTGPRPKLIDPSTLGDSVFVGTFRGKGFQGVSKAEGGDDEMMVDEQEEDDREATPIDGEEVDAEQLPQEEQQQQEEEMDIITTAAAAAAAKELTPPTVPKSYALVKETTGGDVRLVTDSELKQVATQIDEEEKQQQQQEEEEKDEVLPSRVSSRRTTATTGTATGNGNGGGVSLTMLEKMVIKLSNMEDAAGAAWLSKMAADTASNVLQTLGSEDPMRAVMLQELMEASAAENADDEQQPSASSPLPSAAAGGGDGDGSRRLPRSAAKRSAAQAAEADSESAGWDSEATQSDGGGDGVEAEGPPLSARPRRASAQKKKTNYCSDGEEDEELLLLRSGRKQTATAAAANKRRKSSSLSEHEHEEATATVAMESMESIDPLQKEGSETAAAAAAPSRRAVSTTRNAAIAISARGHTNRGRIKQKSHKSADLVSIGTLQVNAGWHNAGYIFPEDFHSRTLFRSSVALDQLCVHECYIVGKGGAHWPLPTFKVVALDRPEEPLIAKSCTGCWTGVLKRINAEIEARRKAGEDLPPPPKTAIAGPEYFGLNQPNIQYAIEDLDAERRCLQYWAGKEERQKVAAGMPAPTNDSGGGGGGSRPPRAPRATTTTGGGRGGGASRRRRGGGNNGGATGGNGGGSDSEGTAQGDDDEAQYTTNRWSSISRTNRYRKRLEDNGDDTTALDNDADNPVPEIMDPITLEPVTRPAISPYGHVMGAATWKAVLAESGVCPFTKQPLKWEQCRILTLHNIEAYRDKIIR